MTCVTPADFLRIYFDFIYYLGLAPFRFRLVGHDKESGYEAHSSIFHKVTAAAVQLLIFYSGIRDMISLLDRDWQSFTPLVYFDMAAEITYMIFTLVFFNMLWRKNKIICVIMNLLSATKSTLICSDYLFESYPKLSKAKPFVVITCTLCILSGICHIVLGVNMDFSLLKWTFERLIRHYAGFTEFTFFIQPNVTIAESMDEIPTSTGVLMGFYTLMKFYTALQNHFSELFVFMFALSFWKISKGFVCYIDNNTSNVEGILERFGQVKKILRKCQSVVGPMFLCSIVRFLSNNAGYIAINNLTSRSDFGWLKVIFTGFLMVHTIVNLLCSADAAERMWRIKTWLTSEEIRSKLPKMEFLVVFDEIRQGPVGLRASGLPVATYGFIRTVFGVFISYVILMLQFQTTSKRDSCTPKQNSTGIRRGMQAKGVFSLMFD